MLITYLFLTSQLQFYNIFTYLPCRNPTLAKFGGEAQHLEKLEVRSLPGLLNV